MPKYSILKLLYTVAISSSSLVAQKNVKVHIASYVGLSYVRTSYDRYADYAPSNTIFSIYSPPRGVYGLGLSVNYKLSAYFNVGLTSSISKSGYGYKIHEYLNRNYESLEYSRVEVRNDLLLRSYIFTRKVQKSKKDKKNRIAENLTFADKLYCISGYSNSFKLSDKYSYDLDNKSALRQPFKSFNQGFVLGFGNGKGRLGVFLLAKMDITKLAPEFGGRLKMRQVVLNTAYRL